VIRAVTFPLRTRSENVVRGGAFAVAAQPTRAKAMGVAHAIAKSAAKQRRDVRLVLDSQFTRPKLTIPESWTAEANCFTVTITRIAVGTLDFGNLVGALKGVEDEVAAWLGLDDRSGCITWKRLQQRCKGAGGPVLSASGKRVVRRPNYQGLRIEVVDLAEGPWEMRHVGPPVTLIGEPEEQPQRGRPGVTAGRAKRPAEGSMR
jgi:hypothetical protein